MKRGGYRLSNKKERKELLGVVAIIYHWCLYNTFTHAIRYARERLDTRELYASYTRVIIMVVYRKPCKYYTTVKTSKDVDYTEDEDDDDEDDMFIAKLVRYLYFSTSFFPTPYFFRSRFFLIFLSYSLKTKMVASRFLSFLKVCFVVILKFLSFIICLLFFLRVFSVKWCANLL